MKDFLKKLTSRKFLACAAGIAIGACMIFGLEQDVITAVAGAVTAVASVMSYIMAEGKIDAASISKITDAVDKVNEAVDVVSKIDDVKEITE